MSIKQLAGQTMWYGLSNILARFINVLVTPILTYLMADGAQGLMDMGSFGYVYAYIAVANIVFTYGMETGYFRFSNREGVDKQQLFNTTLSSHLLTTLPLCALLIIFRSPINDFFQLPISDHWVTLVAVIIGLDTICTIPFARLRQNGRPKTYALIKISSVVVYLVSIITFLYIIPTLLKDVDHAVLNWIRSQDRVLLIIAANMVQNIVVFLLLSKEWSGFRFQLNTALWKKILSYSAPMILIGLAGMVNEVLDREFLKRLLPHSVEENLQQLGVYNANYKIAVFITLFIQAFRLGAEPFFFKQSSQENAPRVYAQVLKWFTITLCIAFLIASLNLPIITYINQENFRVGIGIVPVLLLANVFLGLYYNLSMWYKITDKMIWGIVITIAGALITVVTNYLWIPTMGIMGAAYATLTCYFSMCVLAYAIGRKYYPVPYPLGRISLYLLVSVCLYLIQAQILRTGTYIHPFADTVITAIIFLIVFIILVLKMEKISPINTMRRLLQKVRKR